MSEYPLIKSALMEAIGTLAICLYSNLNLDPVQQQNQDSQQGVQERIIKSWIISSFFVIMAMSWVGGKQTTAQLSPFLSMGLFLTGGLPLANFVLNLLAQFTGTFCGYLINRVRNDSFYFNRTYFRAVPLGVMEGWSWFILATVFLLTYSHRQASRGVWGAMVPAAFAGLNFALAKIHMLYFNFFQFALVDVLGTLKAKEELWISTKIMVLGSGAAGVVAASLLYKGLLDVEFPKFTASDRLVDKAD